MTDPYDPSHTAQEDLDASLSNLELDTDGDGYAETTMLDTTGDGLADTIVVEDPYSGAVVVGTDLDGDGIIDTVAADLDGDGLIDEAYTEGEGGVIVDDPAADTEAEVAEDGPFVTDDPAEDPAADPAGDDGVHGDPIGDMEYHQAQPGPVDCLPTSVAMSLSELTGTDVPADDVIALANDNGFMTDTGMQAEDALTLFESYGVDAELSSGTVDGLREALDAGDTIVVGIDAADVYNEGGGPFDPGMESGHAVVITGISDGPPGMVYINDPGFPDGAGVEIPLETFEDAWEDSDNTMVVATPTEGAADDAAAEDVPVDDTATDDAAAEDAADPDAAPAEDTTAEDAFGSTEGDDDGGATDGLRRLILLPLTFKLG